MLLARRKRISNQQLRINSLGRIKSHPTFLFPWLVSVSRLSYHHCDLLASDHDHAPRDHVIPHRDHANACGRDYDHEVEIPHPVTMTMKYWKQNQILGALQECPWINYRAFADDVTDRFSFDF